MPRPTVRTPENEATILQAVANGATFGMAAGLAGMSERALHQWKGEDAVFAASIKKAKAERALQCLQTIGESGDWRSAAWWLERTYPEDFALVRAIERVLRRHGLIAPLLGTSGDL